MSEIGILIGKRIRDLRKQKGLSQEDLGQLSDLHPKYISSLERAEKNVSLEAIEKVALAFGMTLEELFRNLQPVAGQRDEIAAKIYNLVFNSSIEDQKFLYEEVERLLKWKKRI